MLLNKKSLQLCKVTIKMRVDQRRVLSISFINKKFFEVNIIGT